MLSGIAAELHTAGRRIGPINDLMPTFYGLCHLCPCAGLITTKLLIGCAVLPAPQELIQCRVPIQARVPHSSHLLALVGLG
jgi:hypothetical protein